MIETSTVGGGAIILVVMSIVFFVSCFLVPGIISVYNDCDWSGKTLWEKLDGNWTDLTFLCPMAFAQLVCLIILIVGTLGLLGF